MTKRVEVRILKDGRYDWPCRYAKVSGRKSNGDWVDANARTDDDGYATIEWEMGSDYLECICVDEALARNRYINGYFQSGRSYTLRYDA
jgi:hypothetical protein